MGAIIANNVGKKYKRYRNHWGRLFEWVTNDRVRRHDEDWVLRGIDFKIAPGEAVGIIGQNGAGKSTLLKILTGTTQLTEGSVSLSGRVAALLELGMGFHPELSGRQNAIMGCQMLGLNGDGIAKLLPEIVEFSELGSYIEQPLRTYSSGMQMRLAFSVATAIRPDILIVDEALSVGDTYFKHKSVNRISKFLAAGTTLLFVSHDPGAVKTLCERAIMLEGGRMVKDGDAQSVMDFYQTLMIKKEHDLNEDSTQKLSARTRTPTKSNAKTEETTLIVEDAIEKVGLDLLDKDNRKVAHLVTGERLKVAISVKVKKDFEDLHIGFGIRNRLGVFLYEANTYTLGREVGAVKAGSQVEVVFDFLCDLAKGDYAVTVGVADSGYGRGSFKDALYFEHKMKAVTIIGADNETWAGWINLKPMVKIAKLDPV